MAMLRSAVGAFLLVSLTAGLAADQAEDDAWRKQATAGEVELVETVNALFEAYQDYYEAAEKIGDPVKQREYYKTHDPSGKFIPKLIEIEKKNRGTRAGLMACKWLEYFSDDDNVGRRHFLGHLHHYVDDPLCVEIIRYLSYRAPEPTFAEALKKQIENERVHPVVRDACRLYLAEFYFSESAGREYRERRLKELEAGDKPQYHFEREDLSKSLERYPDWETIRKHEAEAVALLKQLVAEDSEHRLPLVKAIVPKGILRRLDDGPNTNPRLAEMAEGFLFKEQHLKVGKTAPDLKLKLLGGEDWSLHAQRGRVVIIQFSFKGCGPCEGMYPDLRELAGAHPDDLAVLSIMTDREEKDSIEAVESGKVTWNVSWDGNRGPINTRWGVQGYPTVYVIDKMGHVAGYALRGEELKKKVAALISPVDTR